jgi:hypothetical protein
MQENDLEDLIARFVTAIEIAEATAQTLQAATAPLTRVSARIETLEPPLTQHQAQLEELAQRLPALTVELTSAASHLRRSLRPPVARIWGIASAFVLATSLLLVGTLTTLRPQWCLTEPLQDQLRIGRLLAERFSHLPEGQQRALSSLLQELSSPTTSRSNSRHLEKGVSRSGSARSTGR